MIYEIAGKRQLIVWLSDAIYGLDPNTGKQYWRHDYPVGVPVQRPAVNIITVQKTNEMLFISTFYHGPMMLNVTPDDQVSDVWKGKSNNPVRPDGAHCLMASPIFKDGYGYAVGSLGELRCFKAKQRHALIVGVCWIRSSCWMPLAQAPFLPSLGTQLRTPRTNCFALCRSAAP